MGPGMRPECSALLLGDHATAASPSVSSPVRRGCTGRCIGIGGAGSSGAVPREHADGTADGPEAADGAGRFASACGEQCAVEAHALGLAVHPRSAVA